MPSRRPLRRLTHTPVIPSPWFPRGLRPNTTSAAIVFFLSLAITVFAAFLARRRAIRGSEEDLAGRQLNRWLIGLSAATTANSAFIVTGAVGLGYSYGLHWLLLPLSWLLGDLVFWRIFPGKLNKMARSSKSVTFPELIAYPLSDGWARAIILVSGLLITILLSAYASAQWLAGKKMMTGVFHISDAAAVVLFALLVVSYSSIGGFRGSIYTDVVQACIRVAGTIVALISVIIAVRQTPAFVENIRGAGADFLSLFAGGSLGSLAFIVGYAMAAIGFGLGQPQIISRYMAGRDPEETRAAQWIYIGFIQGTCIAMTVFGILLRGVMPRLADPESGLSTFFLEKTGAFYTSANPSVIATRLRTAMEWGAYFVKQSRQTAADPLIGNSASEV